MCLLLFIYVYVCVCSESKWAEGFYVLYSWVYRNLRLSGFFSHSSSFFRKMEICRCIKKKMLSHCRQIKIKTVLHYLLDLKWNYKRWNQKTKMKTKKQQQQRGEKRWYKTFLLVYLNIPAKNYNRIFHLFKHILFSAHWKLHLTVYTNELLSRDKVPWFVFVCFFVAPSSTF